jgi:hypothetical protein
MSGITANQTRAGSYQRTGIVLIILSCALYALLFLVPFLPVRTDHQLLLATGLLLSSEATFWIGCLIAGKQSIARLRAQLWPSAKRSTEQLEILERAQT